LCVRVLGSDHAPPVILLHGGPGAPGSLGSLPADLAPHFCVYEPYQRGSRDGGPLTVAQHVADLHQLVERLTAAHRRAPALVGHSWGAMLALVYGARHPDACSALALIGCGTFDLAARAEMKRRIAARITPELARQAAAVAADLLDEDERLRRQAKLLASVYNVDPIVPPELPHCDARANRETWDDMLRLQAEGVVPAEFAAITAPVLMLHGVDDPHPGAMIAAGLRPFIPRLEYREWPRCGHEPWQERAVRDDVLQTLTAWLRRAFGLADDERSSPGETS
jgi:pimeloyl-ACP methyl ester carboxylesterase